VSRRRGFTLVELFTCLAIIAVLAGLLVPSFSSARERARLISCAAAMHDIHQAVMSYAAMHDQRLPPFSFSDLGRPVLPESGHWGGISQIGDPAAFGRTRWAEFSALNLWALVREGAISPERLICPSSAGQVRTGEAGLFPYTTKYSTYCLRFPYSEDLFNDAPGIRSFYAPEPMRVYLYRSGGDVFTAGKYPQVTPMVRLDRRYRIDAAAACGDGEYSVASDAMFADAFWWRGRSEETASRPGLQGYSIRAGWSHGGRFNVAAGDGAVRTITDAGTVRDNSNPPAGLLGDDGLYQATYAERIWQFFDAGG